MAHWQLNEAFHNQATRATILPRDSGVKDFRQCGTLLCHLVTFPKPPVPRRSLRSQAPQLCCCCCRGTRFMASSAGPAQHTTSKQWDWVRSHEGCRADVSKQNRRKNLIRNDCDFIWPQSVRRQNYFCHRYIKALLSVVCLL